MRVSLHACAQLHTPPLTRHPRRAQGALGARLAAVRRELLAGSGLFLLRGLPVEAWGVPRAAAAFWALGLALGTPLPQNKAGHLLGHVKDIGGDPARPETRLYTTSAAQPYHTDSADIVRCAALRLRRGVVGALTRGAVVAICVRASGGAAVPGAGARGRRLARRLLRRSAQRGTCPRLSIAHLRTRSALLLLPSPHFPKR
jgi:hypothetical protein